jgi:phosphomevalonate kinase
MSGSPDWRRCYSAPGKAFLFGDLAALLGARGAVAALDRRVSVAVAARMSGDWEIRTQPGPAHAPVVGGAQAGGGAWRSAGGHGAAREARLDCALAMLVESDVRALAAADGTPLGLGSSAASCLALCRAMAPQWPDSQVVMVAIAAHRSFQGGVGSGYDVIAGLFGGIVVVRPLGGGYPFQVSKVAAPRDLVLVLCRWQTPVATAAVAAKVLASAQSNAKARGLLEEMARLSDAAGDSLIQADSGAIVTLTRAYASLQRRLGEAVALPLVPAAMTRLDEELRTFGAACKPSGAGADLTLIWCPVEHMGFLKLSLDRHGLTRLDVAISESGLRQDR